MRILLTGGTGFIGRQVLKKLDGHEILLLTRDPSRVPKGCGKNVRALEGDLEGLEALKERLVGFGPECCVHLAWEDLPDFSQKVCERNRILSTQLFNLLVDDTKCGRIVAAGTYLEYAARRGALGEDDPIGTATDIAQAKKQLFNCGMALANACGIRFHWLRLFTVYGPGQRPGALIPTLAMRFNVERVKRLTPDQKHRFKADIDYEVRTPAAAHDFVYVEDAAEAFAAAAAADAPSGAYNIGTGRATKVAEVCGMLEERFCGHRNYTGSLPAGPDEGAENAWADPAKARDGLGWSAKTSLTGGIDRYLAVEKCGQLI